MAPQLDGYFQQVDALSDHFIERLRKAVAIPSVSADEERRPDVVRMGEFLADELTALGAQVEKRPLGKQPGMEHLELPPVVIARYGNDKKKRTILVYGHYDVQPAGKEDGWATEPFELTIDDKGRMYGRGSTDDKGPVLGWLNAIEAHQKAGVDFPVNLLMCFEGMEEYGSEGLDDFIKEEADKFFADTDAVCISDNYWLGTEKPCLTYGKPSDDCFVLFLFFFPRILWHLTSRARSILTVPIQASVVAVITPSKFRGLVKISIVECLGAQLKSR